MRLMKGKLLSRGKKKISGWWTKVINHRKIFLAVFILSLIIIGAYGLFNRGSIDKQFSSISLLSVGQDSISTSQALTRNHFLVNTLLLHISMGLTKELAEKDSRTQARLFYVTIIAALMAVFFYKEKETGKILLVGITIVLMMYMLDIHLSDLQQRQFISTKILSNAKDTLVNMSPYSAIYYNLNFDNLFKNKKAIDEKALNRKIQRALQPDIEQNIFYILPLIMLISLYFKKYSGAKSP